MTEITKITDVDRLGNRKNYFLPVIIGNRDFLEPISKPRLKNLVRAALKMNVKVLCHEIDKELVGKDGFGKDGAIRVDFQAPITF